MGVESIPIIMHSDILKYLGICLSCRKPRVWEIRAYCLQMQFLKKHTLLYAERLCGILTQVTRYGNEN